MNNKHYSVYKHTTPNNKVYIGITGRSIERRWQGGKNYKSSTYFYNAINKYGWDNIKHEILYINLSKEEAEKIEIELIAKYKSNNNKYGYNIQTGGHLPKMSEATKKKISCALKGKKYKKRRNHTQEEKQQISNKLKGRISPMKGKHWSIEQRSNVGIPIICINTGEEFYSIREASRVTSCDRSNIAKVLKRNVQTDRGVVF